MRFHRLFGWWFFAEAVISRLTVPKGDIHAADRRFEELLQESWLFRVLTAPAEALQRAWGASKCRELVAAVQEMLGPPDGATRVRIVAIVSILAGVTSVLVQMIATIVDSLEWSTPLVIAFGGVLVLGAADPIARALGARKK